MSRVEIDQARLLTLQAARCIDTMGTKLSRKQVGFDFLGRLAYVADRVIRYKYRYFTL